MCSVVHDHLSNWLAGWELLHSVCSLKFDMVGRDNLRISLRSRSLHSSGIVARAIVSVAILLTAVTSPIAFAQDTPDDGDGVRTGPPPVLAWGYPKRLRPLSGLEEPYGMDARNPDGTLISQQYLEFQRNEWRRFNAGLGVLKPGYPLGEQTMDHPGWRRWSEPAGAYDWMQSFSRGYESGLLPIDGVGEGWGGGRFATDDTLLPVGLMRTSCSSPRCREVAARHAVPKVEFGKMEASPSAFETTLANELLRAQPAIEVCYRSQLSDVPHHEATIVLAFSVNAESRRVVVHQDFDRLRWIKCVVDALEQVEVRLPIPADGIGVSSWPIRLILQLSRKKSAAHP